MANTAPTITSYFRGSTPENVSTSAAVYTATATDPDAGTTLIYSISGGADARLFNINASNGAVTFKTSPNYEMPVDIGGDNVYEISVRASDGSLYADKSVTISITDVSEINQTYFLPTSTTYGFYNGHTYIVTGAPTYNTAVTYSNALLAAGYFASNVSINGVAYLAEIGSVAENSFVSELAYTHVRRFPSMYAAEDGGGAAYVWLGGNDISVEGQWKWISGENSTYTNWDLTVGNEPNGSTQDNYHKTLDPFL
jgi:hypothetical protein